MFLSFIETQKRVNRDYETMFETGVDEMSWDDTVSVVAVHIIL